MFSNCFRSFQICTCEALKYHQHIKNGSTCQAFYPGMARIKAMACIAASKEFVAVDDMYSPKFWQRLFGVRSSKDIVDANSDDEIGVNNEAPVPTSSEMRNIMENMRSYLDK
ncbi:hypothetical protein TNCV_356181 [Trichonephila clavipes]|nr:hypothetical protein TNCV_356181 [Trichonephila clavipes]